MFVNISILWAGIETRIVIKVASEMIVIEMCERDKG